MSRFDITQTNVAVERLIETTTNPRHLYLLHAYNRHRYLEMAGRFEDIFAPDMTVEKPVYHFNVLGMTTTLEGAEAVKEPLPGVGAHRSVRLLWQRRRETRGQRHHDRLDVDHLPADPRQPPRRRRRARGPRRHLPDEDRRAHDLALRRPRPPDRRGCLGIRRVSPRDHLARSGRGSHRGTGGRVARPAHQAAFRPQPVHRLTTAPARLQSTKSGRLCIGHPDTLDLG